MDTLSAAQPAAATYQRMEFTGRAGEYFGIWIVNILLTVLTLGIYSAWAKVRRKRYFLGNTVLLDRTFDYHASGKQILIGRLIVFVIAVVYNGTLNFVPPVGIAIGVAFMLVLPWFAMRSLRFNARVTSYRNVRFDFVGTLGGAYLAFLIGPLVAVFSLGILAPFTSRWLVTYMGNNMRYGGRAFATSPALKALYKNWLFAVAIFIGGLAVCGAAFFFLIETVRATEDTDRSMIVLFYSITFLFLIIYAVAGVFYSVGVRNIAFSTATFDHVHQLKSDLPRLGYFWLLLSNILVTLVSFGLMRPWAAVREARYTAKHTALRINGDIGQVAAQIKESGSAIGSEYMDMEGFDFGF